jgi:hypothetical protein
MKSIVAFFKKIIGWFTSDRAKQTVDLAAQYVLAAMPFIRIAGEIVTTLTPSGVDDAAWDWIQSEFPQLFDGSIKSAAELKLYALGIASELLAMKFPQLDTTAARLAVQAAYVEARESDLPVIAVA